MTTGSGAGGAAAGRASEVLVQLTDRRTGSVHRVDGRPLSLWVAPSAIASASARLMEGRDPEVWSVRVLEMAG